MEFDKRLDSTFLHELYDGDAVYAATVFGAFLQEVESMMHSCLSAINAGEITAFQKAVHKLKPTLHYVGLTDLGQQLDQLEKACDQRAPVNELSVLYNKTATEIKALLPLIQTERDKLSALTINTH